jgi:hypothetical protein
MHDEEELQALVEALHMENDLLAMEVAALRAELASGRPEVEDPRSRTVSEERLERLARAERDLERLLRRLGRAPQGWLIRRTRGYRNLAERYLDEDGT